MRDREQPGADGTARRVVGVALPEREEDLLYDVLGERSVAEQPTGEGVARTAVALVELLDRGLVAAPHPGEQIRVLGHGWAPRPIVHGTTLYPRPPDAHGFPSSDDGDRITAAPKPLGSQGGRGGGWISTPRCRSRPMAFSKPAAIGL